MTARVLTILGSLFSKRSPNSKRPPSSKRLPSSKRVPNSPIAGKPLGEIIPLLAEGGATWNEIYDWILYDAIDSDLAWLPVDAVKRSFRFADAATTARNNRIWDRYCSGKRSLAGHIVNEVFKTTGVEFTEFHDSVCKEYDQFIKEARELWGAEAALLADPIEDVEGAIDVVISSGIEGDVGERELAVQRQHLAELIGRRDQMLASPIDEPNSTNLVLGLTSAMIYAARTRLDEELEKEFKVELDIDKWISRCRREFKEALDWGEQAWKTSRLAIEHRLRPTRPETPRKPIL